jgi:hypothetical protein
MNVHSFYQGEYTIVHNNDGTILITADSAAVQASNNEASNNDVEVQGIAGLIGVAHAAMKGRAVPAVLLLKKR